MSRQPVYGESRDYRVISGPNGTWIAQKRYERSSTMDTRDMSGWDNIGTRSTQNDALSLLPKGTSR